VDLPKDKALPSKYEAISEICPNINKQQTTFCGLIFLLSSWENFESLKLDIVNKHLGHQHLSLHVENSDICLYDGTIFN